MMETIPILLTVIIVFVIMRVIMVIVTRRERICRQCGHAFPKWGQYCPRCGQKYE